LELAGEPYSEVLVRLYQPDSRTRLLEHSPTAKVPVLLTEQGPVWDSLAIAEYLAERFPDKHLWPASVPARARARSVCAEMHSGFGALRAACPMNIEADLAEVGQLIWRDKPAVRADVARLVAMWRASLSAHQGPMLFGDFSIADAFFAPVCMRLKSYALPVPADIAAYIERLCALPGVKAWIAGALVENDFREFEEPYRLKPA
jgi:glutathione S-transferase